MSKSIAKDYTDKFRVSTVQTDAGGAPPTSAPFSPFSSADYNDETPWPFETMVFPLQSSRGVYHEAYLTEESAIEGHKRIMEMCKNNALPLGKGIDYSGNPSLTPEEFKNGELQGK